MSRTSYEWMLIDYANWAAGAVTVPVYETSSPEQVEWILADSSACAVFAETSAHNEIISSVRGRLPGLAHLWMTGGLDALASGGTQISDEQLDQRRTGRTAADLAGKLWKKQHGRPADASPRDLADDPELIAEIQRAVDDAKQAVSRAESIRRFRLLGTDFTEASGQLTPTLKVRRDVVANDFAVDIEALYSGAGLR